MLENQCMHRTIIGQSETSLDLRYNISALTIAICSEKYMLPEEVFSIIENKKININDEDMRDMLAMRDKGMTYRKIGEIYGIDQHAAHGRVRRYKDKKRKEPSDGNLKSSRY